MHAAARQARNRPRFIGGPAIIGKPALDVLAGVWASVQKWAHVLES